ncbi:hypothetical protein ACP8HI_22985 [Paenibacillus sp. FA6]|uniref:hypothetical protein n=1 Tax=Paenibacillus sp. FA6 TaxID=3413029 RepID=UPI003F658E39
MIYKAAPYILIIGLLIIVSDGLWVVDTYDSYVTYSKETYIYLVLGICLTIIAYLIIQHERRRVTQTINNDSGTGKDNRVFINKMWRQKEKVGGRLIVFFLVTLVIISIFDFGVAVSLLQPILFLGFLGFSFLYIMKDEGEDKEGEDIQPKSHKIRYLLRQIDYREHPFSLALILFIMIVLSFMLSKHFGFELSLGTSGNSNYVMSLPDGAWFLAELVFACGFIYIIQHCHFFGIRQANQGDDKVMLIHFAEIIICGATFLIWIMTLVLH